MQEQLKILYQLQELDDEIMGLKEVTTKIPEQIEEFKNQIEVQQEFVDRKQAGMKGLVKSRKDKEIELEEFEQRIKNDKTKMMEVKTNKEYHAIQKEITDIEESMGVLEEEILLMMDDIEQYDVEVKRIQARFNNQKQELEQKILKKEEKLAEVPGLLGNHEKKRTGLIKSVKSDLLKKYEATKKQRSGQAVAFVERGICMGCHMEIRPQLFNQIQRNEDVYTCPNCYRILFFPGEATKNELEL